MANNNSIYVCFSLIPQLISLLSVTYIFVLFTVVLRDKTYGFLMISSFLHFFYVLLVFHIFVFCWTLYPIWLIFFMVSEILMSSSSRSFSLFSLWTLVNPWWAILHFLQLSYFQYFLCTYFTYYLCQGSLLPKLCFYRFTLVLFVFFILSLRLASSISRPQNL